MGENHVTAARARDEPASALEPPNCLRAGHDGEARHRSSLSECDVDDLDSTANGTRFGFDVEPAFDRLSNVRESVISRLTLAGAAGQLRALGNEISVLACVQQDTNRHPFRW